MKKQITFLVLLALVGAFMFSLEGCGDDPKPNPCIGKKPLNADFTIKQHLVLPFVKNTVQLDTLIATDTIAGGAQVQFIAKHDSVTYEWKIGEDSRSWTTKKVALNFNLNGIDVGNVRIRLIARWKPNPQCFPKDDGVDTVFRSLTILADKDNPIYGKFEGYNQSNPSDIFHVELKRLDAAHLLLTNINKGCDPSLVNGDGGIGFLDESYMYRRYFFIGTLYSSPRIHNCLNPQGVMFVSADGKNVKVNYSQSKNLKEWDPIIKEVFTGKRIN